MSETMHKECREKFWYERTQDEKIEKLADYVYRLVIQNRSITEQLDRLRNHKHLDNEIVTPFPPTSLYGFNGGDWDYKMLRQQKGQDNE